jgi:hypothetical protein
MVKRIGIKNFPLFAFKVRLSEIVENMLVYFIKEHLIDRKKI